MVKKIFKKSISVLLVAIMLVGSMPFSSIAFEDLEMNSKLKVLSQIQTEAEEKADKIMQNILDRCEEVRDNMPKAADISDDAKELVENSGLASKSKISSLLQSRTDSPEERADGTTVYTEGIFDYVLNEDGAVIVDIDDNAEGMLVIPEGFGTNQRTGLHQHLVVGVELEALSGCTKITGIDLSVCIYSTVSDFFIVSDDSTVSEIRLLSNIKSLVLPDSIKGMAIQYVYSFFNAEEWDDISNWEELLFEEFYDLYGVRVESIDEAYDVFYETYLDEIISYGMVEYFSSMMDAMETSMMLTCSCGFIYFDTYSVADDHYYLKDVDGVIYNNLESVAAQKLTAAGESLKYKVVATPTQKQEIIITEPVEILDTYAFYMNFGVKNVVLPDTVTDLGIGFAYCINLESAIFH